MEIFRLTRPTVAEVPVLVEVPHAGLAIPECLAHEVVVPRDAVMRDADLFVDELWEDAPSRGAPLFAARCSRFVVDLNRAADDVDRDVVPDHPAPRPTQSRGVVWRVTTDGRAAMSGPLSHARFAERIAAYHAPYHAALAGLIESARAKHGRVIVVAAHSMPSTSRDGATRRADIVPGSRGRTSADPRVIDLVDRHFRAAGLSVRHDDPYRGGWTTGHYGRPSRGVHAIQIEVNRALYLDEVTMRPDDAAFPRLRGILGDLVERLSGLSL